MRTLALVSMCALLTMVVVSPAVSAGGPYNLCTFNKDWFTKGPIEEASVDPDDPDDPVTVRTRPLCWW